MHLLSKSSLLPNVPSLFNDFFDGDSFPVTTSGRPWINKVPAVNVAEEDHAFEIALAVPGMEKKDFRVDIDGNTLRISCERTDRQEEKNKYYTRQEFNYNSFSRTFHLPDTIASDQIKANYQEGILKITMPKKEETKAQPKKEINIG